MTRVELRTPTADDRAEFVGAMRASRALHHPWLAPPATDAAFANLVARERHDEAFVPFLVCLRDGGAIVGFANISQIIRGPLQSAFLGYGAVVAFARRGFMTEGLDLVLRHAFTRLQLHRLEANVQPGNTASIALLRRCGFEREGFSPRYLKVAGRWRDHERWAIRAEQWHPARRRP